MAKKTLTPDSNNYNIVSNLSDQPNINEGLTAAQLKATFDEAGNKIKTFVNGTLISELQSSTTDSSGAHAIGYDGSTADNVADALDEVYAGIKATNPPDGSVTPAKLDATLTGIINAKAEDSDLTAHTGATTTAHGGIVSTTDFNAHLAEKATEAELGHVKVDGETIFADTNGIISTADRSLVPLYENGEEFVTTTGGWIEGYKFGQGSQLKNADHLYLYAYAATGQATITYVTNSLIDLSGVNTLYVDWENTGGSHVGNYSVLAISPDKMASWEYYNARIQKSNIFARTVDAVDVSNLNGEYYVRIHANDGTNNTNFAKVEMKIYKIWGRK